jgi:ribosome-binding factor A
MSSLRLQRVRELLKREIGEIIRREFPAGAAHGLITVNDVTMSGDLHSATVFVGILGTAEQQKHGWQLLQLNRKRIQGLVGHSVILKYTPQLRFIMDESVEHGNKVLKIMEELERTGPVSEDPSKS